MVLGKKKKIAMALNVSESRFFSDKPNTWWKHSRKSGSSMGKGAGITELEANLIKEGCSNFEAF